MDAFRIKEKILEDLAIKSLEVSNKIISYDSIIAESGRIERIAESYYISSPEKEYNQFIIDWIEDNFDKILYSEEFSYDVTVPDNRYENNLENYLRR